MHPQKNIDAFDLLKFILCFFVVSIHTMGKYSLYPFVRMAVPIFFILSAYLFFRTLDGTQDAPKLKKFLLRNARLYAFWFVALLPVFLGGYLHGNLVRNFAKLAGRIVLGSSFAASWYLAALMIGVTAVYLLRKYIHPNLILLFGLILYLICCANSNYRGLFSETGLIVQLNYRYPGTIYNSFPVGILWIAIGNRLATAEPKPLQRKWCLLAVAVSCGLLVLEYAIVQKLGCAVDNDCYLMLIPVSVAVFLAAKNSRLHLGCAGTLRKLSTIVYCLHGSAAEVLMVLLPLSRLHSDLLAGLILFGATAAVSVLVGLLLLRLERCRGLHWLRWSH